MTDIKMCNGWDCAIKKECYRHTADPNPYRQSYFTNPHFEKKMGGTACEYFWDNRAYELKEEDDEES